jgi:hypothetical protein
VIPRCTTIARLVGVSHGVSEPKLRAADYEIALSASQSVPRTAPCSSAQSLNHCEPIRTRTNCNRNCNHTVSGKGPSRPCDLCGDHAPWDRLAAPQLLQPRRGSHDYAKPAPTNIPAVDPYVDSGELITAQLPMPVSARTCRTVVLGMTSRRRRLTDSCRKPPGRAGLSRLALAPSPRRCDRRERL